MTTRAPDQPPRREAAPSTEERCAGSREMLELSREECLRLLAATGFGRVAVACGDGPPIIRPVNYVFDTASQSVVFRTAAGSKLHALLQSAGAAFEIDGVDDGSRTGWSVIVRGVTDEVTQPSERARLDSLVLEPWPPGHKPHWMHVRAWTISGRRIVRGADAAPRQHR
jgi:nitroimidazol reductase NimA-like FMN-containing flavoprotein (pyridoxamine 5'-phosphate oxidase superfamily)